jgi:hypothetical protein
MKRAHGIVLGLVLGALCAAATAALLLPQNVLAAALLLSLC